MPARAGGPLDLCRAPDGFTFRTGVWLAHDVDMAFVADTVAPLLAGTPDPDPERRRRLAAEALLQDSAEFLVLGSARRLGQVSAFPSCVAFVGIGGRVMHAKCAVIQFAKPNSPKRITRAFVTSANLTRHSMSNREVLVWEEAGSQKTSPTLAHDLIRAIRLLSAELDPKNRARVRRALRLLAAGLPASGPARCVADSLGVTRPLLADIAGPHPKTADRLVIVSPPFAGDNDKTAAKYLLPWVGLLTRVDVFTGVEAEPGTKLSATCRPAFSRSILKMLAAKAATAVSIWGVPSYDDSGRRRPLHAKVVAIVHGDVATVVAGSANCSGRGLGGENRELVIRQDWSRQRLEAWLEGLDAITFEGEVSPPERRQEPPELLASLAEVTASFEPAALSRVGKGKWHGVLRLDLPEDPGALRLSYRGGPIKRETEQPFDLWEREAWLTAAVSQSERRVPIEVCASDDRFWEVPPDTEGGDDPLLLALLRALRPPSTPSKPVSKPGQGPVMVPSKDDRYWIEPRRALTLLARMSNELRGMLVDGLGQGGKSLFPDLTERQVAEALLGGSPAGASSLLVALAATADDLGEANE